MLCRASWPEAGASEAGASLYANLAQHSAQHRSADLDSLYGRCLPAFASSNMPKSWATYQLVCVHRSALWIRHHAGQGNLGARQTAEMYDLAR